MIVGTMSGGCGGGRREEENVPLKPCSTSTQRCGSGGGILSVGELALFAG